MSVVSLKKRFFLFVFLSVCLFVSLFVGVGVCRGGGGGVGKYYLALFEALGIFGLNPITDPGHFKSTLEKKQEKNIVFAVV